MKIINEFITENTLLRRKNVQGRRHSLKFAITFLIIDQIKIEDLKFHTGK
jgi:hypothetical protein